MIVRIHVPLVALRVFCTERGVEERADAFDEQ